MLKYSSFQFCFYEAQEASKKLDDLGVLIEKLLAAQNQSISKLNQLINLLETMMNGTGNDLYVWMKKYFNQL